MRKAWSFQLILRALNKRSTPGNSFPLYKNNTKIMNNEDELKNQADVTAIQGDLFSEEMPVVEKPKRKRGRPSKAELAARAAAEEALKADKEEGKPQQTATATEPSSTAEDAPAEEPQAVNAPTDEPQAVAAPKRRRRRTKEEIIQAAEAAAAALAQSNQQKAEADDAVVKAETPVADVQETQEEHAAEDVTVVPESTYQPGDTSDEGQENKELMQQLQQKIKANNATVNTNGIWEGDPGDGTDFIILQDLPVEDSETLTFYDNYIAGEPQLQPSDNIEETTAEDADFDFDGMITACGLLEIMPDGYGFLRSSDYNYLSSPDDVHLTTQQVKSNFLKTGDIVECYVRPPYGGERYFTMTSLIKVNGRDPKDISDRISFENLTPLFPEEKFNLTGSPATTTPSTRIVDLFAPLGKGQRSLIVAQPKTGKTMLMKDIANAIAANHPEAYIMMLLIDERPEEVTDMSRTVNAEVIASTFDEPAERHVKIASLVLEKAKRLVECGHDVVIFLDSITRLARAYNTVAPASGKVLTGGVDANALQKPKRFFGAARNIEGGGSLTIVATALTDTGSKMDDVIFEEFKGTGNSELQLDRQLANKRIFPAINLVQSSTRRDDLLLDEETINKMWVLRKSIADMNATEAMTRLKGLIQRTRTATELFMALNS